MVSLPDAELVTILANLIDNAIEACDKIPEQDKRQIILKIKVEGSTTFLYIENTTQDLVPIRNNKVCVSKKKTWGHGFGLQNVEAVLNRYGGIYAISYDPDKRTFIFSGQI